MLVPASAALATDTGTAELEQPDVSLAQLQTMVADLNEANEALVADNSELQQTVDALQRERDDLRDSLEHFEDLYAPLEADRQLLFELRKDLPETRPEAEVQIARMQDLALSSDPQRLGRLVDRISDSAPAFLDWRFGEHASSQEFTQAYVETGANAFDGAMDDFRSEVLMSVANRLDGLLTILDRAR
jgi:FtsZ-binding cell division protein ZapB